VIAAVNGPALIHAELAVLSDIVLAAEHAEFADLAHGPTGVVPGDGVQDRVADVAGPEPGTLLSFDRAETECAGGSAAGCRGEWLAADQLMPRARELARRLAALPRRMLRHTRTILVRDLRRRLRDEIDLGLAVEALATL